MVVHVSEAMTLRMINVPVYKHWRESVESKYSGVRDVVKQYKERAGHLALEFQDALTEVCPVWRKVYNDAYYSAKKDNIDARKLREEREIIHEMASRESD